MPRETKNISKPSVLIYRWLKRGVLVLILCCGLLLIAMQVSAYKQDRKVAQRLDILTTNVPNDWIKTAQYHEGAAVRGFSTAPRNHVVEYFGSSSEQIFLDVLGKSGATAQDCEPIAPDGSEIYCSGRLGTECAVVFLKKIDANKVIVGASSVEYCTSK